MMRQRSPCLEGKMDTEEWEEKGEYRRKHTDLKWLKVIVGICARAGSCTLSEP